MPAVGRARRHARGRAPWRRAVGLAALVVAAISNGNAAPAQAPEPSIAVDALPSAPAEFDRSSPRAVMRAFFAALEAGAPSRAAAALRLPPAPPTAPAELAQQLGAVIERRLWLTAADLPDRRDGAQTAAGLGAGQTPAPRRSVDLGALELDRFPLSIRLNRYSAPDGRTAWLFDPATVAAAPALYARYGPGRLEQLAPPALKAPAFWGLRWWEVVTLPALALSMAAAAWLSTWALGAAARRVRGATRQALRAARAPMALLTAATLGQAALGRWIAFSAPVTTVLSPLLVGLMILAALLVALRVIDAVLDRATRRLVGEIDDRYQRDARRMLTSLSALRRLLTLAATLLGVGLFLYELDVFVGLGMSLLASAGVLTVVLGIAGQTVLGNILASMQIAIAKPIRIGDSVKYEGDWSYVEAITYTFVRLRTWDDRRLIVPVQYFISHPFQNWSVVEAKMTQTFWLTLDHDADTDAVRAQFESAAREDPDVLHEDTLKMLVLGHSAEGVECRFYVTATDPATAWDMHGRMQEAMIAWIRRHHPDWWPRERVVHGAKLNAVAADG